jgi:cytochrome P450
MTQATSLAELVRLEDPGFYWDDPYPVFRRMRQEEPVFWYEPLQTWVLTRYDDIRTVSRTSEIFSVESGILLNDARHGSVSTSFFPDDAQSLAMIDPPLHRELRRSLVPPFKPKAVGAMEEGIRKLCRDMLDPIPAGEWLDWVETVSVLLPLQVIAQLLGLPIERADDMRFWSDEMMKMGAPLTPEGFAEAVANVGAMQQFLLETYGEKRQHPGQDLLSSLLEARLEGEPLSDNRLCSQASSVLVAGNETTRNLISGAMWSFAREPEQWRQLVDDPSLAVTAVDELLRWYTPVPAFLRTVTEPTEVRGQAMEPGQRVYLLYMAANRDEEVFADAEELDITRQPDPMHLAFGFGTHFCLGAPLARLEVNVLLQELVQRFSSFELGEPTTVDSVLQRGFHHLPVKFAG